MCIRDSFTTTLSALRAFISSLVKDKSFFISCRLGMSKIAIPAIGVAQYEAEWLSVDVSSKSVVYTALAQNDGEDART